MPLPFLQLLRNPDPERLATELDIPGLIRLLGHNDPDIQFRAADALGKLGEPAVPLLLSALHHRKSGVRLGAIEALAEIRSPAAVSPVVRILGTDESTEVRWAAALALGEIGDPAAIPSLVKALAHPDRYIRYGAALALRQLGWLPADATEQAYLLIGLQDWDALLELKDAASAPLAGLLRDRDPLMRLRFVDLLGRIGSEKTRKECAAALRDADSSVRWAGVLASHRCRIPISQLPRNLSKRPRLTPDPKAAAILNFLFLGIGYNYLGLWWGFLVFMSYTTILVLAQLQMGPFIPYLIAYPVTALFATQTYFMAKKIPDL